jgi:outer membrane protein
MNISLQKFGLALALVTLFGISAPAQVRIATVDLNKAFNSYWKKREAESVLKDEQSKMEKELKGLQDDYKGINESYQKLLDSASDPAISSEERDKRKSQADDKLKQMKLKQDEFLSRKNSDEVAITERRKSTIARILAEIRSVVAARAKTSNYTLVLDAGSEASYVIYASGDTDITPDVIKDLNANAPATTSTTDDIDKKSEKKK